MPSAVARSSFSLSREDFRLWLHRRLADGETQAAIGRSLGVSQPCVNRWLCNASTVSETVMLLAEHLYRGPIGLARELPVGSDTAGG